MRVCGKVVVVFNFINFYKKVYIYIYKKVFGIFAKKQPLGKKGGKFGNMLDFINIVTKSTKNSTIIYPDFKTNWSKDLMVRGGSFYAIWDEENKEWSRDENRAIDIIDKEIERYSCTDEPVKRLYLKFYGDGVFEKWKKYMKGIQDSYVTLDEKIIFQNTPNTRSNYSSKKLPYPLLDGECPCYDELMSTLYSPEERLKLEWAIGSIITGDSKKLQKFFVLYGKPGSGKSTFLHILEMLFEGYWSTVNAEELSKRTQFALESFKSDPVVGIQHDSDLSRIESNATLNSLVSHETMQVNEKYKGLYEKTFKTLLFVGTNKPVKITEAKSGLLRRLIDVYPTGETVPVDRYRYLMANIEYELGYIAKKCLDIYKSLGFKYYDDYVPYKMLSSTNMFYDFVLEYSTEFAAQPMISLFDAWNYYKEYCSLYNVTFPMKKLDFKNELENYFEDFKERHNHKYNVYFNFNIDKYKPTSKLVVSKDWLDMKEQRSILDDILKDCPAQYATKTTEAPKQKWESVQTSLKDIDTSVLHYIRPGEKHVVIDFDLVDEDGNKSREHNIKAARSFPATYAEFSKSGNGLHLHYIYDGDVEELASVYEPGIEIKIFTGLSALRRRLSECNNLPITHISSGLPLKERRKKVLDEQKIKSEKGLRKMIERNLRKEIHAGTKPSIDFIKKILDDYYISGEPYDVTDMRQAILAFANNSTNHPEYCLKQVMNMKFQSEEPRDNHEAYEDDILCFFDVEVFPNLFVICWKYDGVEPAVKMINPTPQMVRELTRRKLVGFNNRRYDNHILYAAIMGYSNEELYAVSQKIVNNSKNAFFREAYNLSYTDIYDFASAGNKMGLKKWEIELGIHHQELGLPWDQPVPEELWDKVADYCVNDVIATEATFHHLSGDWMARKILAELSGLTVNDTTNQHSSKIIFGNDRNPQSEFIYTDLSEMFPGYKFDQGKSYYRDELVGEGGYVYAEPGYYENVALLDVASMHPTSIEKLNMFGDKYTKIFSDIKKARVYIKHGELDKCRKILGGKLAKFLEAPDKDILKNLSTALKTAINSVYGLTFSHYDTKFRDPRNIDNIVAKRGALFMVDLRYAVQEKGFTVAHIKTDSIKIPNATQEIIDFVFEFGKKYGYEFEHEETYSKMCLVNDAVYVARDQNGKWSATGAQFQHPYVFKKLFSLEDILFEDMCETKNVSTALYLDMNETLSDDEHEYIFVGHTGQFCPIKPGCGGGQLMRISKEGDKYNSVTGTKGYRWLESESVKTLNKEKDIDMVYFDELLDDAVNTIEKFVPYDVLISDEQNTDYSFEELVKMYIENGELPFEIDKQLWDEVVREGDKRTKVDLPWNE